MRACEALVVPLCGSGGLQLLGLQWSLMIGGLLGLQRQLGGGVRETDGGEGVVLRGRVEGAITRRSKNNVQGVGRSLLAVVDAVLLLRRLLLADTAEDVQNQVAHISATS